jgi:cytochrome c-type biogenesis protein CcmH/NrfG
MADDSDDAARRGAQPRAEGIGLAAASRAKADVYLEEQIELARLQKQNLIEQNAFELSHLRFRRFSDYARFLLQMGGLVVALVIVGGLAAMIWSAYDSGGLTIEPFSVPPDLAARGLTGDVLAAKLLDQLSQMQGETKSQRAPQSFQNYWGQDIKVMIPDTGISLGELERYLDLKLGHATRVSGEVVRTTAGIAMTARAGTDGSVTLGGSESAFDLLTHGVAELRDFARARIVPLAATADARLGNFKAANALVVQIPDHCDLCLRARREIAELEGQHARADWWFARAVSENPSIPFAYSDWGAALVARGKLDDAIAKFESAHRKGSHFADPLEMWGEALIAKNRSDLALAKLEEANKYAPKWGRLHLKWGEALLWSGKGDEAKEQFAAASHLELTPSEKSELAKVAHG